MNNLPKDGFAKFYLGKSKGLAKVSLTEKRLCEARRKAEKIKDELELRKEFEL